MIQSLNYKHHIIPIHFRRSLRAKHIRLTFNVKQKGVVLTLPFLVSKKMGESFLKQKESWIKKQWEKLENQNKNVPKHTYQDGDVFWYLGEKWILKIIFSPRAFDKRFAKRACKLVGNTIQVTLPPALSTDDQILKVKELTQSFYKQKASEIIHDRLEYLNQHYQFTYHRVTFRNQKTRWGSCSSKGNLNFNWRLMMAPIEVIDYVVVHELCHLKEMNHSKKFWDLVSQKTPDHKKYRKWLRENGEKLRV